MSPTPAARSDLFVEEVDGDVIVYDAQSRMAHALNAPAAAILLLCDGETSVDAMAAIIGPSVGAAPAAVLDQVQRVLDEFLAKGLLIDSSGG